MAVNEDSLISATKSWVERLVLQSILVALLIGDGFAFVSSKTNAVESQPAIGIPGIRPDGIVPIPFTTGDVYTTGGNTVPNYWNSSNTAINIDIPVATYSSLTGGTITIYRKVSMNDDTLFTEYLSLYRDTIESISSDPIQTVTVPATFFEMLNGTLQDSDTVTFTAEIADTNGITIRGSESPTRIIIDQTAPRIVPGEISLNETGNALTFTVDEELLLAEGGAVTGFSVNEASPDSVRYFGKGTTNRITLFGDTTSGWSPATRLTYDSIAGNLTDLAGNEIEPATIDSIPIVTNPVTLSAGDVAISGFNTTTDEFSFVLLRDIRPGTKLKFTDNGWTGSALLHRESTLAWESVENMYAGTEVKIALTDSLPYATGGAITYGEALHFDAGGDQVIVYQGSSSDPVFLTVFHLGSEGTDDSNGWNTEDTMHDNLNRSALPQGLTDGADAISIRSEAGNARYNRAIVSGTKDTLLSALTNEAYWITADSALDLDTGFNFLLPPHVASKTPENGATINEYFSEISVRFNEAITVDPTFGGGYVTITRQGTAFKTRIPLSADTITASGNQVTIPFDADSVMLTDGTTTERLIDKANYTIDVDGFLFANSDGNHNKPIAGDTSWSFTYDNTFPTIQSVKRESSANNPATDDMSVAFRVIFDDHVTGVDPTDFRLSGSAVSGGETIRVSSVSPGEYTVTISGITLSDTIDTGGSLFLRVTDDSTIFDIAGHPFGGAGLHDVVSEESFTIIHPEPSSHVRDFAVAGRSLSGITLSWSEPAVGQPAQDYLIIAKESVSGTFPTVADVSPVSDDTNIMEDGNGAYSVAAGTTHFTFPGLRSAIEYDFQLIPYTNGGLATAILYKTTDTIPQLSGVRVPANSRSDLEYTAAPITVSPVFDTPEEKISVFEFTITDDGGLADGVQDNAPTKVSQFTVKECAGYEEPRWYDLVAYAELSDVSDEANPPAEGTVDYLNNEITFITDSTATGTIPVNGTKNYALNVYFKDSLPAAMADTIDGLRLCFSLSTADIVVADRGSSTFAENITISTNDDGENITIAVEASRFVYNDNGNPIKPIQGSEETIDLENPHHPTPVFEARDENGNKDKDYTPSSRFQIYAGNGIDAPPVEINASFRNGKLDLSGLRYGSLAGSTVDQTDGTLTVVDSGGIRIVAAAKSTPISVISTTARQLTGGISPSPVLYGLNEPAILGFSLDAVTNTPDAPAISVVTVRFEDETGSTSSFSTDSIFADFKIARSGTGTYDATTASIIEGLKVTKTHNSVQFTRFDEVLSGLAARPGQHYFIIATVSLNAGRSTPKLRPLLHAHDIQVTHDSITLLNTVGNPSATIYGNLYGFGDVSNPIVTALRPADDSEAVKVNTSFSITFSENVIVGNEASAQIHKQDGSHFIIGGDSITGPLNLTVTGRSDHDRTVTFQLIKDIAPGSSVTDRQQIDLEFDEDYYITITSGRAITDPEELGFAGILNNSSWNFSTRDQIPPQVTDHPERRNREITINDFDDRGFAFSFSMNETGKAYYILTLQSDTAPTANELWDAAAESVTVPEKVLAIDSTDIIFADQVYNGFIHLPDSISGRDYRISVLGVDRSRNAEGQGTDRPIVHGLVTLDTASVNTGIKISGPAQSVCLGNPVPLTGPLIIKESQNDDFETGGTYRISLSSNDFQFAVDSLPAITLSEYNGNGISDGDIVLVPHSIVLTPSDLQFEYSVSGHSYRDYIKIEGLYVKAAIAGASARVIRTGGTAVQTGNGLADTLSHASFTGTHLPMVPDFGFYELFPDGAVREVSTVSNSTEEVQLVFDPTLFKGVNRFSGTGVLGDPDKGYRFYPAITNEGRFEVTLSHTDRRGCVATNTETIAVFDESNAIDGLGSFYCLDPAHPYRSAKVPIRNTKPGYELIDLIIDPDTRGLVNPANGTPDVLVNAGDDRGYLFDVAAAAKDKTAQGKPTLIRLIATYKNNTTLAAQNFTKIVTIAENPAVAFEASVSTSSANTIDHCEDDTEIVLTGDVDKRTFPSLSESITMTDAITYAPIDDKRTLDDNGTGLGLIEPRVVADRLGTGTYGFIYTATDRSTTCSNADTLVININPKPTARFSYGETRCAGEGVPFTNESAVTKGSIKSSRWSFDDLDDNFSAEPDPVHAFTGAGLYDVALTVTTDVNCTGSYTGQVAVGGISQAAFEYRGVHLNDTFRFTANVPKPGVLAADTISEYRWEFGDGTAMRSAPPRISHRYSHALLDTVKLTATSAFGCRSVAARPVAVTERFDVAANLTSTFETGTEGWLTLREEGNSWELSSLNSNTGIRWVTGAGKAYESNERSFLYSSSLNMSNVAKPMIRFDAAWELELGDGVVIQYSTDDRNIADPEKKWRTLGAFDSGADWYNTDQLSLPVIGDRNGWTETRSDALPCHVLDEIATEERDAVNFRFALLSNASSPEAAGFAFDNFYIGSRTRNTLLESFTNTSESSATPKESNYLKTTFEIAPPQSSVIRVNYHTDFPGEDPVNRVNKVDPSARALFYNITHIPTTIIDGIIGDPAATGAPFSSWGKKQFDLRALVPAAFQIATEVYASEEGITIKATPTPQNDSVLRQDLIMIAMVLEKQVTLDELGVSSVPSGEQDFEYVVRKLLPNASGASLNTGGAANQVPMMPLVFSWVPDNVIDINDMAVVVSIQDQKTKEIYQSEIVLNVPAPSIVTGLRHTKSPHFEVYPNPSRGRFAISVSDEFIGSEITITDLPGKTIRSRTLNHTTELIDAQGIPSGVYHIRLKQSHNKIIRKRLVISRSER